jgi:RNA polymerase sigma factor for flagellar operon FliA
MDGVEALMVNDQTQRGPASGRTGIAFQSERSPSASTAKNMRLATPIPQPGSLSQTEDELVEAHVPLVWSVVHGLAAQLPASVEVDDLFSAGMLGLLQAVRHYDPAANCSLETYARLRIRGAILDELRRLDWVPRSVHQKARRVQAATRRLEQAHGRTATDAEIARELGLTQASYADLQADIQPITFVHLDAPLAADLDGETTVSDSIEDDSQIDPGEAVERRDLVALVFRQLEQLPAMQRKVLALYYHEGLRLRDIAAVFEITESRVCQIHSQAIATLKASLRRHLSVLN